MSPAPDPNRPAPTRRAQRVLVVASELPPGPGGIGAHAHAVATELARQGREVRILGSQHYAPEADQAAFRSASAVPITRFSDAPDPARTAARRSRELRATIASFGPDVIVASGGRVQWLVAPAARRAGVPVVAVVHGSDVGGASWQRTLTRRALDRATRIIAVSHFTADLTTALGVQTEVEVVHNGADGARFAPNRSRGDAFRALHRIGSRPMVLTVGNVTRRKGQQLVVEALPSIVRAVPDVVYVVVGRPSEAEALQDRARQLGVNEHLLVLGQLDAEAVVDAHRAADVFAMTSTATAGSVEGFGIAVVEAALCGVPAVVTAGTGAQEAVVHGRTGLAVEPDTAAISEALVGLLTDEARRTAMARAAADDAARSGTWQHRVRRYGEILDEVARKRPRIVVVSHTRHHRSDDGTIVGFGATTRELDRLASLASELVHVAPLHPGPPPGMALPVEAPNVRLVAVPPAGGPRAIDRVRALGVVPRWFRTINREVADADVVHVRCPAGISAVALLVLLFRRTPRHRWVKYAGNWSPAGADPPTYRLQRWWLRHGLARAQVTVNGRWPGQPRFVHAFDNPTLTDEELAAGRAAAAAKPPGPPYRAVFVGRLEEAKGVPAAVETIHELRDRGIDIGIDLIGDGPCRAWVEQQVAARPDGSVTLHGWLTRAELEVHLAQAHVLLLPTTASEGFPKVVAEALAFGCVPVTSGISSMGQVLAETGGAVVVPSDGSWTDAVESLLTGDRLRALRHDGIAAVERFSYGTYLDRVRDLARTAWGRTL